LAAGIALIVGLGNPGPEYARTRHNAGFWLLDRLAAAHGGNLRRESKFHGECCRVSIDGSELWLLKPDTFMNLSGDAVAAFAHFYKFAPEQILVAHDELDLLPGTARLKQGGGAGGHNGLSDTIEKLGNQDFFRLRIGIGHPGSRELVTPYVLGVPSLADSEAISSSIEHSLTVMPLLLAGQINKAMTHLNRRPVAGNAVEQQ
jgi:PTH1 family peptidyl-tRNA hydrolase